MMIDLMQTRGPGMRGSTSPGDGSPSRFIREGVNVDHDGPLEGNVRRQKKEAPGPLGGPGAG